MGMILRNFVIKDIDFYTRVFDAVVITGLTYASEVWRPYRKKDTKKIQNLIRKFYHRVCYRCGVEFESMEIPNIESIFDKNERCSLLKLKPAEIFDDIFD